MRIERWYWLGLFCVISLALHIGLAIESPGFYEPPVLTKPSEIEVTLLPPEPPAVEKKVEPPKPLPQPKPPPGLTEKDLAKLLTPRRAEAKPSPVTVNPNAAHGPVHIVKLDKPIEEKRPVEVNAEPGGIEKLKEERPLPSGLPAGVKDAGKPKLSRIARADLNLGGGGSPDPGIVPGGKDGAKGPEAPPEDIVFNGGGSGGQKLPKAAPRNGGGGGSSILSVENPLAKEAIPEERPGAGPGGGGGQGAGVNRGVGYGRGFGIGTRLDAKEALSTLRSKPGIGIGAAVGDRIGTNPPGGGKGTGSELPGSGGTGIGYGRGSGIGIGNGKGTGVGDGGGARAGRMRGVPFGDVAGLLRGDLDGGGGKGGGPGGPGRGAVFGAKPTGGGGGPVHIAYLLDISGSMRDGNKLGKAKEALIKALNELKPKDSFNIVVFWGRCAAFSDVMLSATQGNVEAACIFVERLRTGDGTNISVAIEQTFQMEELTQIYLLSDGEPTYGIKDPTRMRDRIKELNRDRNIRISTLALGLGEQFPGMALLKGIAEDNRGQYSYVNLAALRQP